MLESFDLHKPFEVEIDVSDYAMKAILLQEGKLICYHSKKISGSILN